MATFFRSECTYEKFLGLSNCISFLLFLLLLFPSDFPFSISFPWQIALLGMLIELILALLVDTYSQNLQSMFFGKSHFVGSNSFLNTIKYFMTLPGNKAKEVRNYEQGFKVHPVISPLKHDEEFLISNFFTAEEEFDTYKKDGMAYQRRTTLMTGFSFFLFSVTSIIFILVFLSSVQIPSVFLGMFFVGILFFSIFKSKRNYFYLQRKITGLNKFFRHLDFTLTRINVSSFYHADRIVLNTSRELLKGYFQQYEKSVRFFAKTLSKLKLINTLLSILVIFVLIYFIIFFFGLEFNFLMQISVISSSIQLPRSLRLGIFIVFFMMYSFLVLDTIFLFSADTKLHILSHKRVEVKNALLKVLKIKSDVLKQVSSEALIEDISKLSNFLYEVDSILNTQPDYYAYFGRIVKIFAIIIGLISSALVLFNFLS